MKESHTRVQAPNRGGGHSSELLQRAPPRRPLPALAESLSGAATLLSWAAVHLSLNETATDHADELWLFVAVDIQ